MMKVLFALIRFVEGPRLSSIRRNVVCSRKQQRKYELFDALQCLPQHALSSIGTCGQVAGERAVLAASGDRIKLPRSIQRIAWSRAQLSKDPPQTYFSRPACRIPVSPFVVIVKAGQLARLETFLGD